MQSIALNDITYLMTVMITSMIFSFAIAFPIISLLYRFRITRRMTVDFTTMIEKRNLKIGVPIMGGLIMVITIVVINLFFNPFHENPAILLLMFIFVLSALLGGFDDVLNIFGRERAKPRKLDRTFKLIKVHKNTRKRIQLALSIPWEAYKRFFFILGSNPGKGIQAHEKILVQSIAGLTLGIGIYFFTSRENPGMLDFPILGINWDIGILIIPFAWIAVLLMTNAVNLADGMDGLAASLLFPAFFGYLIIAYFEDGLRTAFLIATVLGSLISYLYFNVPPARFQMGDVGSLAMGTLLAGVAFLVGKPLYLLIIAFPFVATLLSTVIQGLGRRLLGRRILRMAPLHYHFQMKFEWSEEKVVMRYALFAVFFSIVGVWLYLLSI